MDESPENITVTVLTAYDEIWTMDEFQTLIAEAVAKIPAEYRATAVVELEKPDEDGYGGDLEIRYVRPENSEEMAKRIEKSRAHERAVEARELYEYERLKAKFG